MNDRRKAIGGETVSRHSADRRNYGRRTSFASRESVTGNGSRFSSRFERDTTLRRIVSRGPLKTKNRARGASSSESTSKGRGRTFVICRAQIKRNGRSGDVLFLGRALARTFKVTRAEKYPAYPRIRFPKRLLARAGFSIEATSLSLPRPFSSA